MRNSLVVPVGIGCCGVRQVVLGAAYRSHLTLLSTWNSFVGFDTNTTSTVNSFTSIAKDFINPGLCVISSVVSSAHLKLMRNNCDHIYSDFFEGNTKCFLWYFLSLLKSGVNEIPKCPLIPVPP